MQLLRQQFGHMSGPRFSPQTAQIITLVIL